MSKPPSIEALAAILDAIDDAAKNPANLDALLDVCADDAAGVFSGAVLLKAGYGRGSFVLATTRQCSAKKARSWMRWPLRRLFARMKPCRILDPFGEQTPALAIPFSYGAKRFVVIAPLVCGTDKDSEAFFSALESITIPDGALASTRDEIPFTPIDPIIAGFGLCDDLFERVSGPLRQRGWSIARTVNAAQLWDLLRTTVPHIIAVDAVEIADPLTAITSIHRIADSPALRIIAFGQNIAADRLGYGVIDSLLPHDAEPEPIFKKFKTIAEESLELRHSQSSELDRAARQIAAECVTPLELVNFGAEHAAQVMRGWAFCALVDQYGAVYRAEFPILGPTVLSALPKSFLSDGPKFATRIDDDFLAEITDDPSEQMALIGLRAFSGASVPILSPDGRRLGSIVACARERAADSAAFDGIDRFGKMLGARLAHLQSDRGFIPEFWRERKWQRFRDRGVTLNVYRSPDCETPWGYRPLGESNGLLTLGVQDDAAMHDRLETSGPVSTSAVADALHDISAPNCFAGVIDFSLHSIAYAARGFSPPLSLGGRGPAGTIETVRTMTAGVTTLKSLERAAICDEDLWRWLRGLERGIENLPQLLDNESPSGVASIVTMGSSL